MPWEHNYRPVLLFALLYVAGSGHAAIGPSDSRISTMTSGSSGEDSKMRYLKYLALLALLALPAAYAQAQVSIGVQIGPSYGIYNAPPVCAYGFYPAYPFGCAPYGYYGPEWFADGVFIGAGPWYRFYYTRPAYYRPFYFNRGFGGRGGFEHFRGPDRFRGGEFRSFRGDDRDFRDEHRGHFRGNEGGNGFRGFDGGGRSFRDRGGRSFHDGGGRGFREGGDHGFRGGSQSHGRGGSHGSGGSHGGRESHGGGRR